MSEPPKPPFELPPAADDIRDPLAREALMWLAYLHSGEASPEDHADYARWQAASDDHQRAAARAARIWDHIGRSLVGHGKPRKPVVPIVFAAFIGISAVAFAAGLFGPPASFFADYRSSTGQVRNIVLRDGSAVDLDTGTSFDVSDGDRTITLHTGQVFVQVTHGSRPFTVVAGNARAVALGTAFAVRRDDGRISVLVAQSAVRVRDTRNAAERVVDISAGHAVTLTRRDGLGQPQEADVGAQTAWRRGELTFAQRPLDEVVAELDRYRAGKIVVMGDSIRSLPVTGSVDISRVDQFLASLEVVLPVKVLKMPGFVLIRPADIF